MNKKSHYVSTLTYQMEATMKLCYGFMKNYFEASDRHRISFDEYVVLDTLICYSHLDAKLISKTLYRKETEIKDILLKLEKKKLIRKTPKPKNEIQVKTYEITEEGDRIYKETANTKDELIRLLAKFLSENELMNFTKTLLKIKGVLLSLNNKDAILNN